MFLLGIASLLFTLPHFLTGDYQYTSANSTLLCPAEDSDADCTTGENSISELSQYLYVFMFAQVVFGIGAPSVYSLGVTFIDESVPSHTAGFYVGKSYVEPTPGSTLMPKTYFWSLVASDLYWPTSTLAA